MSEYKDELKDRLYLIAGLLHLADTEWAEVYEFGPLLCASAQRLAEDGTSLIDEDEYDDEDDTSGGAPKRTLHGERDGLITLVLQ